MPVNPFQDYPMNWRPARERLGKPLYLSLAAALEEDILSGALPPHTKLPPQRELADFLDIGLSTVTRAFAILESKGLLYATVGRGTFVAPNAGAMISIAGKQCKSRSIELGILRPLDRYNGLVADTARELLQRGYGESLLDYGYGLGMPYHIDAGKKWISAFLPGDEPQAAQLIITAGAQNALLLALIALFNPGDRIAVEAYTYPNFIALAKMLRIQLLPVQADGEGMLSDELEQLCRQGGVQGVYLIPSCNNPTAVMMGWERRKALGEVIHKHGLILLENDLYAFLNPSPLPSLRRFAPERAVYIGGMSKAVSAGLRVAYAACSAKCFGPMVRAHYSANIKTSSLNAEIAAALINEGRAAYIAGEKRTVMAERNALYNRYFGPDAARVNPNSMFRWLPLGHTCHARGFEQSALKAGVSILHSDRFLTGSPTSGQYLRVSLCAPDTEEELARALDILKPLVG